MNNNGNSGSTQWSNGPSVMVGAAWITDNTFTQALNNKDFTHVDRLLMSVKTYPEKSFSQNVVDAAIQSNNEDGGLPTNTLIDMVGSGKFDVTAKHRGKSGRAPIINAINYVLEGI